MNCVPCIRCMTRCRDHHCSPKVKSHDHKNTTSGKGPQPYLVVDLTINDVHETALLTIYRNLQSFLISRKLLINIYGTFSE